MNYLVGYSADRGGREALALGAMMARGSDVRLIVCTVVPERWDHPSPARVDAEYATFLDQHARRTLAQARAALQGEVHAEFVSRSAASATDGLIAAAEEFKSGLIVLGSARHGPVGRFTLGSVTASILPVAPVPVGLCPKGYAPQARASLRRLTCAYVGASESRAVLDAAVRLCRQHAVPLRLVTLVVRDKQMYPSGIGYDVEQLVANQWRAQAVKAQQSILPDLPGDLRVETAIGDGPDWKQAVSSLPWEDGEVLVLGSSARSAAVRALLGGDATRIVRSSPVPVIVIPRGAAASFAESQP
jgi:nucleotide-binding universal stress UspA family protein